MIYSVFSHSSVVLVVSTYSGITQVDFLTTATSIHEAMHAVQDGGHNNKN